MKTFINAFVALTLLFTASANAITISVDPLDSEVNLGDTLYVDINISDLGMFSAPSISTYDLDLIFSDDLFAVESVEFGSGLDVFGLGSIQMANPLASDTLNLFELSLDFSLDLIEQQAGSFNLARVAFSTLNAGIGSFDLMVHTLGNANGVALDYLVSGARAQVSTPVPEPSTAWFMVFAAAAFGLSVRRQNQTN